MLHAPPVAAVCDEKAAPMQRHIVRVSQVNDEAGGRSHNYLSFQRRHIRSLGTLSLLEIVFLTFSIVGSTGFILSCNCFSSRVARASGVRVSVMRDALELEVVTVGWALVVPEEVEVGAVTIGWA